MEKSTPQLFIEAVVYIVKFIVDMFGEYPVGSTVVTLIVVLWLLGLRGGPRQFEEADEAVGEEEYEEEYEEEEIPSRAECVFCNQPDPPYVPYNSGPAVPTCSPGIPIHDTFPYASGGYQPERVPCHIHEEGAYRRWRVRNGMSRWY